MGKGNGTLLEDGHGVPQMLQIFPQRCGWGLSSPQRCLWDRAVGLKVRRCSEFGLQVLEGLLVLTKEELGEWYVLGIS